jgi:hypothetical protein
MDSIFWGIVGSIIGALAILLVQELIAYVKARRGVLTGEWNQMIPAQQDQPAKLDRVHAGRPERDWRGS